MKWVEVKMRELGVLGNEQYKITAMLDHAAMVTVQVRLWRYRLASDGLSNGRQIVGEAEGLGVACEWPGCMGAST